MAIPFLQEAVILTMRIGLSTACYYPQPTEEALAAVVEGGADCTEIFFNAFSELTPAFLGQLQTILAGGRTQVVSIHPFTSGMEPMLFFGDYPRRMEDGLEMYKLYFQALATLGGRYLVLHGAYQKKTTSYAQYLEAYGRLDELAKSFGVRISQENVGRCMSSQPALFRALRQAFPDACFTLDLKQCLRCDYALEDFLDAMGPNLCHLHLSDADDRRDCLPVGEGSFDFASFLGRMHRAGYQGDGVLELYNHNYSQPDELWDSVRSIQKFLNVL